MKYMNLYGDFITTHNLVLSIDFSFSITANKVFGIHYSSSLTLLSKKIIKSLIYEFFNSRAKNFNKSQKL